MKKLLGTVTRRPAEQGVVYLGQKRQPLRKIKDFSCRFAFRDGGRLLQALSRPGVFAHRRIDAGARQVLNRMEIRPGDAVLDIGCGSGVLSLAAAARAAGVRVHAVDSNARAVHCTAAGAELNGLSNLTTELNCSGGKGVRNLLPERPDQPSVGARCFAQKVPDTFSSQRGYRLALANPPYYASFQIARRFLLAAHAASGPAAKYCWSPSRPSGTPSTCRNGSRRCRSSLPKVIFSCTAYGRTASRSRHTPCAV